MKKAFTAIGCIALTAAFAVGAAACNLFEGATHSNLKKEGWEEIVEYAGNIKAYRTILTTECTGQDLISETFEADAERPQPRFHYQKLGNAAGTLAEEYIEMDSDQDSFRYSFDYSEQAQMWRWIKWNATPSDGEKDAAVTAFKTEYDLRVEMLNILFYPEGNSDGVDLKGLYDYLKYSGGKWKGDMAFNLSDALYQGSVEVENMPDNIESFRKNSTGLLFRLKLKTTTEGVTFQWTYDIQGCTNGFITTLPANAEFISD